MIRTLTLVAAIAVTACGPLPGLKRPAPDVRPAIGPEVVVRFNAGRRAPRLLLESVAARCWLDGVVRGAQMIVNRQTGNIIIVGDTTDLLAADFLPAQRGTSRVRLSGPVIAAPAKTAKLVASLDRAARTGETACPIATG